MGTRTGKAIETKDVASYISSGSTFSFELKTLKVLSDNNYVCDHAGTYVDPITKKYRQFDIRAHREFSSGLRIALAVECKNISKESPLLAHCVPRRENETYHSLIKGDFVAGIDGVQNRLPTEVTLRKFSGANSIYSRGRDVCKSLSQIWEEREGQSPARVIGKDGELHEKWNQALSSCDDLIESEVRYYEGAKNVSYGDRAIVMPVLVVPDETLWVTFFTEDGTWSKEIANVKRVSFYVDRETYIKKERHPKRESYFISHLEVVTFSEIPAMLKDLYNSLTEARVKGPFS